MALEQIKKPVENIAVLNTEYFAILVECQSTRICSLFFVCVCSPSVFPQRPELSLYSGRASLRQRSSCCLQYSQRNGKHGLEISQEVEKQFPSTIFYTSSPNAKSQKPKWFQEDSLGQGIPAQLFLKKGVLKQPLSHN